MAELFVYGIVLGSIIALGAIGLTLIYGIINFANFAHGDYMALGAYVAFFSVGTLLPAFGLVDTPIGQLSFGWAMLLSFIPSMLIVGIASIGIDRLVFKPLRDRRAQPVIIAIASLGIAFIVRSVIYLAWGPDIIAYSRGIRQVIRLPLNIRVRSDQIVILLLTWTLVVLLYLFLQKTKVGKALRAMADNRDLARISGIATDRMVQLTWLIGGGLAAAAGIMLGIDSQLQPEMGWAFLLPLFAAVILGSIGNIYGALVGGLVIGVAQQMSTAWLSPGYKPAIAFVILIIILLIRPQGIFGESR